MAKKSSYANKKTKMPMNTKRAAGMNKHPHGAQRACNGGNGKCC